MSWESAAFCKKRVSFQELCSSPGNDKDSEETKVCVCSRGCDKDRMPPKKLGKVGSQGNEWYMCVMGGRVGGVGRQTGI